MRRSSQLTVRPWRKSPDIKGAPQIVFFAEIGRPDVLGRRTDYVSEEPTVPIGRG